MIVGQRWAVGGGGGVKFGCWIVGDFTVVGDGVGERFGVLHDHCQRCFHRKHLGNETTCWNNNEPMVVAHHSALSLPEP